MEAVLVSVLERTGLNHCERGGRVVLECDRVREMTPSRTKRRDVLGVKTRVSIIFDTLVATKSLCLLRTILLAVLLRARYHETQRNRNFWTVPLTWKTRTSLLRMSPLRTTCCRPEAWPEVCRVNKITIDPFFALGLPFLPWWVTIVLWCGRTRF